MKSLNIMMAGIALITLLFTTAGGLLHYNINAEKENYASTNITNGKINSIAKSATEPKTAASVNNNSNSSGYNEYNNTTTGSQQQQQSEKECTQYESTHLLIIGAESNDPDNLNGCNWLVNKVLDNSSYILGGYSSSDTANNAFQKFVLTQ